MKVILVGREQEAYLDMKEVINNICNQKFGDFNDLIKSLDEYTHSIKNMTNVISSDPFGGLKMMQFCIPDFFRCCVNADVKFGTILSYRLLKDMRVLITNEISQTKSSEVLDVLNRFSEWPERWLEKQGVSLSATIQVDEYEKGLSAGMDLNNAKSTYQIFKNRLSKTGYTQNEWISGLERLITNLVYPNTQRTLAIIDAILGPDTVSFKTRGLMTDTQINLYVRAEREGVNNNYFSSLIDYLSDYDLKNTTRFLYDLQKTVELIGNEVMRVTGRSQEKEILLNKHLNAMSDLIALLADSAQGKLNLEERDTQIAVHNGQKQKDEVCYSSLKYDEEDYLKKMESLEGHSTQQHNSSNCKEMADGRTLKESTNSLVISELVLYNRGYKNTYYGSQITSPIAITTTPGNRIENFRVLFLSKAGNFEIDFNEDKCKILISFKDFGPLDKVIIQVTHTGRRQHEILVEGSINNIPIKELIMRQPTSNWERDYKTKDSICLDCLAFQKVCKYTQNGPVPTQTCAEFLDNGTRARIKSEKMLKEIETMHAILGNPEEDEEDSSLVRQLLRSKTLDSNILYKYYYEGHQLDLIQLSIILAEVYYNIMTNQRNWEKAIDILDMNLKIMKEYYSINMYNFKENSFNIEFLEIASKNCYYKAISLFGLKEFKGAFLLANFALRINPCPTDNFFRNCNYLLTQAKDLIAFKHDDDIKEFMDNPLSERLSFTDRAIYFWNSWS